MARAICCPACQKPLHLPEALFGQQVRCPECDSAFVAEAPADPEVLEVVPVARKEEQATDTEAELRGSRRAGRSSADVSKPPSFTIAVKDPDGIWKGTFQAQVMREGLKLSQKANQFLLPVGSPTRYVGRNVLEATCEGRDLRLTVTKWFSYQNRLAQDLVAFLDGTGAIPQTAAYGLPWYFYLAVALPLGIPVVTLGGALPVMISLGLAAANFTIVQRETWPKMVRLAITLAIALGAYVGLGVLLWLRLTS
jgi:hypothetical protein